MPRLYRFATIGQRPLNVPRALYHHGHDFEVVKAKSSNVAVTLRNVHQYLRFLDRDQWQGIDFSRFSKVRNPDLERYEFSPEAVLREMAPVAWPRGPLGGA